MTRIATMYLVNAIAKLLDQRKITPQFADRLTRQIERLTVKGTADYADLVYALHVIAADEQYPWPLWAEFWAAAGEAMANGLINGWIYTKREL